MRLAAFDNSLTRSLVVRAWSTASFAIRADSCTWRLISLTDDDSSSVADATDCTLVEASSEAAATAVVSSCDRSAVAVSVVADASSSVEAEDTVSTISPTAAFELVGEPDHVRLALLRSDLILIRFGFSLVARFLFGVLADHRDGLGEVADLVAAAGAGNDDIEIAAGHFAQGAVQPRHRPRDAEEREQDRSNQRNHHHERHDQADPVGPAPSRRPSPPARSWHCSGKC